MPCPEIDAHKGESHFFADHISALSYYAQLCLPWIPMNPFLWIPVPPDSLYVSDVRFTT